MTTVCAAASATRCATVPPIPCPAASRPLSPARAALRRAYASGTTRVSYDGKSVDYGSAEDLLGRIRTIERAIAGTSRPLPIAGLAGFSRGDR